MKEITIATRLDKYKDLHMSVYITDDKNYFTWLFDRTFNTLAYDFHQQYVKQIDALKYFFEGYNIMGGNYEE